MTTSDLEALATAGDATAFGELIRVWDHDLRAVVWTVVRSAHATDGVMQSAYEKTFRNIHRFDGKASLKTWLHTICLRGAIDHSRSDTLDSRPDGDEPVPPLFSSDAANRVLDTTGLDRVFDSLDEVGQLLVMLTAGLGYSFDETAAIVGMAPATVASKVGRARAQMTGDRPTKELSDSELRAYLQSRVPAPGAGYWDQISGQLEAAESRATEAGGAFSNNADSTEAGAAEAASGRSADAGDKIAPPASMQKTQAADVDAPPSAVPSRLTNQNMLALAALVLVVVLGTFAVLNRSGDDAVDLATASQGQTEGDTATTADAQRDQSPLQALQARLAGQVTAAEAGGGNAGPYCFTSDDAYVFPADELSDRRALGWLDITSDGTVNYAALQGDSIAISGSGIPTADGVLMSRPIAFGAASGDLPPYEITITDTTIGFAPETAVLDLVGCASVQDRIDIMFSLPQPSALDAVSVSADWPLADAVLSSAGLGPIKVGMTVSELEAVLGAELDIETIGLPGAGECGQVAGSDAISNDVWILLELTSATEAIVRRVSVSDGRWSTPSGISVGMTEQNVIDTFPNQIESTPHAYVEGTYLTYVPASDSDPNTVQFVNEGGTIVQMHAGDRAWVGLVEGCA